MSIKIEITTSSGNLLAATRELIEQRLKSFAGANRRTKEVRASVDDGDPAKPVVEITAQFGTEKIVGTASAGNILQAVEAAIDQIQSHQSQQREERSDDRKSAEDAAGNDAGMKLVGGVAGILFAIVFAVTMVQTVSCTNNPANYPDTAPVTGTVTLDGQPLSEAELYFTPTAGGRPSGGTTDASGKYSLQYTGTITGAMLGEHRVTITKVIPEDPDDENSNTVNVVPEGYGGTGSELSAQVEAKENVIDFDLTGT